MSEEISKRLAGSRGKRFDSEEGLMIASELAPEMEEHASRE